GADQKLFFQHDARWISPGLPGEGNMLVFNNRNPGGDPGPPGDYSTVNEIVTPVSGFLYTDPAPTFLPTDFVWSYEATPQTDFIGRALSGAQRLPNGNTLVCNGAQGTVFEVTPGGTEVWRWVSPVITGGTIVTQGTVVVEFTNLVFKCDHYPGDSGALAGRDLPPGWTIEPGTAQTAAFVSPADSAMNVGTLPTFQWSAAINAISYALQVSSDASFGSLVVDQAGIIGTSYSVTSKTAVPLPEGVYFWKVQSSNGFGVGGPSETRIFSTNETLLPVELVAFRARTTGEGEVVLTWETATETNNAGFDVEHQFLTDDFEPIAFVVGLGTTLDPQSYRLTATDLEPGLHTFRLKQIDLDGRFAYHGPVQIELEAPTALWLATPYPNPFNPRATVRFSVSAPGAVELNVYDVVGHLVQTLYRGDPGADRFVEATFDGTGLSSGVYVIRLESEFGLSVSKTALLSK
ncbi:MAG: T9SS type A sorting domain-containing protein, partial [Rhodothermia bacterium]